MLRWKSIRRVKEVVQVLFKYELHHFIEDLELRMHLPFHKRFEPRKEPASTQPETIRQIFEELGGAFIKLGQLLALRPDLIGEAYSKEFEKLLLDVPPEDPQVVKQLIKGLPLKKFKQKPLGSASIAEVHEAYLNNKKVAVKIKRPDIEEKFHEDIEIMRFLAKKIKEKYNPSFVDPEEVVEEFKHYTDKELDLKHEATNIKRFYKNFQSDPDIIIPQVFDKYTTNNILVMEYVEGKNILTSKKQNKGVIKKVTSAVYKMLFEHRFFHADLHPGNIYINKGKIILLDFGIAGHIDKQLEVKLFNLFSAMVEGNLDNTTDALLDLNISTVEPRSQMLKDGIYEVLGDFYNQPLGKMNFEKIFYGCIDVAKRSNLKFPASIVLFGKSLVTMDGFCREIDPKFNVVKNAKPYVHKIVKQKIAPKKIVKQAKEAALQYHQMLVRFPSMVTNLGRKITRFEARVLDIDNTFQRLTRMIWRVSKLLVTTILFATFFISSIILIDRPPLFGGYSVFTIIGMIMSIILFVEILNLLSKQM